MTNDQSVTVPLSVLRRALFKARREYVRACKEDGVDPGPDDQCWAEFERLAEYVDAFNLSR